MHDDVLVRMDNTSDEVRTTKLRDLSRVTVASGMLVALEADGETTSRLRAIDVTTADQASEADPDPSSPTSSTLW